MTRPKRGVRRKRTPLELWVLIASIAAIAVVLGGLIAAGATASDGPPDLRVSVDPVGSRSGGVVYELTVENHGGETAENVVIEVTAGDETREIELLSVAKDDEESASVVFPSGTSGRATAAVLSYHGTSRG